MRWPRPGWRGQSCSEAQTSPRQAARGRKVQLLGPPMAAIVCPLAPPSIHSPPKAQGLIPSWGRAWAPSPGGTGPWRLLGAELCELKAAPLLAHAGETGRDHPVPWGGVSALRLTRPRLSGPSRSSFLPHSSGSWVSGIQAASEPCESLIAA